MSTDPSRATPAAPIGGAAGLHQAEITNARREIDSHLRGIAAGEEDVAGRRRMIARWKQRIVAWGGEVENAPAAPAAGGVAGVATVEVMVERAGEFFREQFEFDPDQHEVEGLIAYALTGLPPGPDRDAVLARLAEPRAPADLPPLSDAAAVREAAQAVVADKGRICKDGLPHYYKITATKVDALLDTALAAAGGDGSAGDGWRACGTCFTPDACRSWQTCGAVLTGAAQPETAK